MKFLKGNNKYYLVGGAILLFLLYKFIGPRLTGGGGGGSFPLPMPDTMASPSSAPNSAPLWKLPIGGEPGFISGGGMGMYQMQAPGPAFLKTTMPLTSIHSAYGRIRVV